MTKQQLNVRIPDLTRDQIDALCDKFKMTPGELVAMAVDRIFQEEKSDQRREALLAATAGHEAHSADGKE